MQPTKSCNYQRNFRRKPFPQPSNQTSHSELQPASQPTNQPTNDPILLEILWTKSQENDWLESLQFLAAGGEGGKRGNNSFNPRSFVQQMMALNLTHLTIEILRFFLFFFLWWATTFLFCLLLYSMACHGNGAAMEDVGTMHREKSTTSNAGNFSEKKNIQTTFSVGKHNNNC